MTEMLDIVNESDEVIGQAPRSEVHAKQRMHRAVHILLFNCAGEIFLQLRSMTKDTNPGCWDSSAAGHVDAGEDYEACAVRELQEELGIAITAEQCVEIGRVGPSACNGFEFVRVYSVVSDAPVTLEEGAFASTFITIWQNTQH